MKKILLFVAGLMLAMSASAGVYLRGNGNWDTPDPEFEFTDNGDGTYTLEKSFQLKSAFKISDEKWSDSFNYGSSSPAAIGEIPVNLTKYGGDIVVNSLIEVTKMILDTNAGVLKIEGNDGGEITYSTWTICGVAELVGDAWDPTSTANVMTESNGVYTLTKEGVSLSTDFITDADTDSATPGYGYKVAADGKWDFSYPSSGNQFLLVDAEGVYNVTFTWDPTAQTLSAEATLVGDNTGDDNTGDDNTGDDNTGDDNTGDDITPGSTTYYLIGYINGADYGCEGDYENMGDYKFVDGSVTATFEIDSYVFVKTEGNGAWFMSEGFAAESPATLINTNEGLTDANKLKVPGGVEVTFTLVENADGTLTLSYTTGTATDLEDVDAEDAIVAAYDLLGRPVAADAAGIVILQYASGKAVKVFNN